MRNIKHLSHSSITRSEQCLAYFAATTLDEERVPDIPSQPRDIGSLTHGMIETYCHALTQHPDEFPSQRTARAIEDALREFGRAHAFAESQKLFEAWLRRNAHITEFTLFAVERESRRTCPSVDEPIIGFEDIIYVEEDDCGELYIARDCKTSWSFEMDDAMREQGRRAVWRLRAEYPHLRWAYEIDFVRSAAPAKRFLYDPSEDEQVEARIRAAYARIGGALDMIETGTGDGLPRSPGKHCGFCPLRVSCGAEQAVEAAGLLVTEPENARMALLQLALLDEARETLRDALKAYCAEHGPVEMENGSSAGFSQSVSYGIKDVDKLLAALAGDEVATAAVLKALKLGVGSRATKAVKALAEDPRVKPLIGVTSTRNAFDVHIAKDGPPPVAAEGGEESDAA